LATKEQGFNRRILFTNEEALLARVEPTGGRRDGVRTLDRLGVDDPRRGHRIPAHRVPSGVAQRVVDAVSGAIGVPPLEYQYTVSQGGKSCGNCRHEHPVRFTYKIASTIRRRECTAGRPPGLTGTIASINAHCPSVKSDG
jgi:hypothetical protein